MPVMAMVTSMMNESGSLMPVMAMDHEENSEDMENLNNEIVAERASAALCEKLLTAAPAEGMAAGN